MPGIPGAPALPGQGLSTLKAKKKYKLDVQMRRMNWTKVQPMLLKPDSFWARANEEAFASHDLFQDIEKTFATGRARGGLEVEQKARFNAPKVKALKVLDAKAAQNISILLGTLRMPHRDVRNLVLSVDDEKVTEQMLQQLNKFMPGKDEMLQLMGFRDRVNDLSEAEQFGVVMSDVKRLPERLECMVFRVRFPEEVDELKPMVSAIISACREIRTSKKFGRVLEIVLLMGNYMNAGSRNQQSYGFDLSYLTKLSSTKSADQKTTLLHFLANTVEIRFPDVMDFQNELRNVEEASHASEESMKSAMKAMEDGMKKVKAEVKHHPKPQSKEDKFIEKMKAFLSTGEGACTKLKDQVTLMEKKYEDISSYFSFDPKKVPMEEFFGDLSTFIKEFERARKENAKIREQLEKQRQAREREERARQAKSKQRPMATNTKVLDLSKGGDDQEGLLDNLLETLQSGSAFNPSKKRRAGPKGPPRSRTPVDGKSDPLDSLLSNNSQKTTSQTHYSSRTRGRDKTHAETMLARLQGTGTAL
jgi:hypothetical protein